MTRTHLSYRHMIDLSFQNPVSLVETTLQMDIE